MRGKNITWNGLQLQYGINSKLMVNEDVSLHILPIFVDIPDCKCDQKVA